MTRAHPATLDLLDRAGPTEPSIEPLAPGAALLRGFASDQAVDLVAAIERIAAAAPFRHMIVPGGHTMSAAMTNCGPWGWVTDRSGYRYASADPQTGLPWPSLPALFRELAARVAEVAGHPGFAPDCCLVNRYEPGARMGLHRDSDEKDIGAPIVSVSLGLPATFLFGGAARKDRPRKLRVASGDVAVWGGPSRLFFHGVDAVPEGEHPLTGRARYNLTFRKAR
jgi:alkylated DNA repair protein (DNA oxidative demethylase)